ncbi:hypothetical protein CEXT_684251 [Caerostris extrusa]|uniref:Uncharacterized protein n=1 Tax=Caerostris extrusa TaxID=172846 RepID=A0AAV4T8T6_CAEEX|nr:hypothetical protein CEXT_684251 [Caerostris extrusa]
MTKERIRNLLEFSSGYFEDGILKFTATAGGTLNLDNVTEGRRRLLQMHFCCGDTACPVPERENGRRFAIFIDLGITTTCFERYFMSQNEQNDLKQD